jgi:putative ABC transport system permease protein
VADQVKKAINEMRNEKTGRPLGLYAQGLRDFVSSTSELKLVDNMAWLTSFIALVIGTVGVLNTMIMSVFERTREIGILRAIGWRRARVVRMILAESVLLALVGAVLGAIGAVLLTQALSMVPLFSGLVRGDVAPHVVFLGFLIALAMGLVGGAYPAFRGARLLPTEALRHE